ncbi:ADP-ribosylglycohydrolase family protein [Aspergillus lucknowensis]|uniref:ADP-ribosylhydrolase ARH3 n=1 Tax=Aspergillus lucknowensis TaxID=176173 RepID=A0ABR4LIG1_9EURO
MDTLTVDSRIKGSIFGVAVVDALGGPVEFQPRGTFDPVTDFRHNEHFDVPPGTWTDDTSMTLCLAKSLIDSKGEFISQAAIRNYIDWWEDGYLSATGDCFDIGAGTTKALMTWQGYFDRSPHIQKDDPHGHEGGQPAIDKALKREEFCGNGSLMRVSPIALVYFRNMPEAIANAAASSDVTHPYPTCAEACTIYTRLLVHALNNTSKTNLAADLSTTAWKDPSLKGRLSGYRTLSDWAAQDEDSIKSSGFVVSTLEAALWAFFTTDSFEAGALRAVNLGWDADTVGAVYGGLAGAFYGFEAIPRRWVGGLQRGEIVAGIAEGLVALSRGRGGGLA